MKFLLSTCLLLLIFAGATSTYGKNTLFPGYIITLNNDTLHGFIDYKNWEKNPKHIKFRDSELGADKLYTPKSILEFSTSNEIYKSAIVETERSDYKTNELTLSPNLYIVVDTVFLRALIIGEKSLYYFKDERGKDNFYIEQNSNYELLVYKRYLKEERGKKFIVSNNKYIGQLILYLQNCMEINELLSETSYDLKSLVKAFNYYYDCTNAKMDFREQENKVKLNFSVIAGATLTSLKFRGEDGGPYLTEVNYPSSINFTAGLALDVVLLRNFGRWSFNNELIISSYSTQGSYEDYVHDNRYTITDTKLAFTYLKINNMLRTNFPVNKVILYVNLGFSNGFVIASTNYKKTTSVLFTQVNIVESEALPNIRKHEQSLLLGVGGQLGKFSAELRYETGNGMSNYMNLRSATQRLFLLIGYKF